MSKQKQVKQKEGVKTYTGNRINTRQFKRFLATAKTPEERRAIKSFVLGPEVQYYPKDDKSPTSAAEAVDSAIKGKKAQ